MFIIAMLGQGFIAKGIRKFQARVMVRKIPFFLDSICPEIKTSGQYDLDHVSQTIFPNQTDTEMGGPPGPALSSDAGGLRVQ